ncbi:hypothetical protein K525DRAFT_153653, partial [Schizophyllum commune Loenen D]
ENMADAVWKTLKLYNIQHKIIAFVMDNATNNDTMLEAIERKCVEAGIKFSAKQARLRCMPHTIHLAAMKLLEAIGAFPKTDKDKATAQPHVNYQDSVTVPL